MDFLHAEPQVGLAAAYLEYFPDWQSRLIEKPGARCR